MKSVYWVLENGIVSFENPIPPMDEQQIHLDAEEEQRRRDEENRRRQEVKAKQEKGRAEARRMGLIK